MLFENKYICLPMCTALYFWRVSTIYLSTTYSVQILRHGKYALMVIMASIVIVWKSNLAEYYFYKGTCRSNWISYIFLFSVFLKRLTTHFNTYIHQISINLSIFPLSINPKYPILKLTHALGIYFPLSLHY